MQGHPRKAIFGNGLFWGGYSRRLNLKLEPAPPPLLRRVSRNKYFQALGHGLARPRGVATGQRLFIAASCACPKAVPREGGWSFLSAPVWPSVGSAGWSLGPRATTLLKHLSWE